MRIKNLDCQVSSLLDDDGNWRQFSSAWPPISINRGDPTAGGRLWAIGDQLILPVWQDPADNPAGTNTEWSQVQAVWTPPGMPDGLQKAVRFSPSPLQPHQSGQRPRCQFSLERVARPDDDAIAADPSLGIPPDPPFTPIGERLTAQPVTGFVNTDRTYVDYFCLDPSFDTLQPNFERATTLTCCWHGSALGDLNTPPIQFNIRRGPTDEGPLHFTLTVAAGRSYPVSSGLPPWPYDSYVASDTTPGGLAWVEVRREFYLTDPDGPGLTKADWHKLAIRQYHHYAVGTGITEVWFDGVKMVGAGGRNIEIPDTKVKGRAPSDPGPAQLGDYSHIPNMFLDNSGPQMQRLAVYCYVPNAGLNPKQPQLYHWQVWNNAIWHTGMGIFSQAADVNPTVPAQVFAPRPVETFTIFGEPSFQRLTGSPMQEDTSLLPNDVADTAPKATLSITRATVATLTCSPS